MTRDREHEHYQTWAGTGPNAQAFWELAGRVATSAEVLDELLDPLFEKARKANLSLSPERAEALAGLELERLRQHIAHAAELQTERVAQS